MALEIAPHRDGCVTARHTNPAGMNPPARSGLRMAFQPRTGRPRRRLGPRHGGAGHGDQQRLRHRDPRRPPDGAGRLEPLCRSQWPAPRRPAGLDRGQPPARRADELSHRNAPRHHATRSFPLRGKKAGSRRRWQKANGGSRCRPLSLSPVPETGKCLLGTRKAATWRHARCRSIPVDGQRPEGRRRVPSSLCQGIDSQAARPSQPGGPVISGDTGPPCPCVAGMFRRLSDP